MFVSDCVRVGVFECAPPVILNVTVKNELKQKVRDKLMIYLVKAKWND